MKIYGLLGHKISYSLSPAMQNAAFKKLKLNAEYRIFDIKPEDLEDFLNGFLRSGISGLNVTVPYKQNVYNFLKKFGIIDDHEDMFGACNTVTIKKKSLFGYNTDADGFLESLKKDLDFSPRKKDIFIFGAGGAGSTCALKLARMAHKIFVYDVDYKKTNEFKTRFLEYFGKSKLMVVTNRNDIGRTLQKCQLLVNATPYGRNKGELLVSREALHQGLHVFDLIYKPEITPIIEEARKLGLKAVNGIGMLLYQGAASFELWTGKKAPVEVMRKVLERELSS